MDWLYDRAVSEENEPDIYRAIKRDAMLENVHIDPKTKVGSRRSDLSKVP